MNASCPPAPSGHEGPQVSVCVAVYKFHGEPNLATLSKALPAALGGLSGELIVALNGIGPTAVEAPPGTRYVTYAVNRGVVVAWNGAVRASHGEMVCVINDDVMLGPGSLRMLYEALHRDPVAGVVGPVGTRWDIAAARHKSWVDTSAAPPGSRHECEVVSGFLLAFRRSTFETVGGFDERLTPCSYEEVDFCTAVRRVAGLACFAVAGVDCTHEFGISTARQWRRLAYDNRRESLRRISRRNRRYLLSKWSSSSPENLRTAT
jgi:GT2 family glycosyltransferase